MSKRKIAPTARHVGANPFNFDALLAMNQRSLDAMTRMNAQICQSMVRVNTELINFTNRRLTADFEVAQKLTGAARPQDAVEAVLGFQRQIIADYAAETRELVTMCTTMDWDLIPEIEDEISEGAAESSLVKRNSSTAATRPIRKSAKGGAAAANGAKKSIPSAGDTTSREGAAEIAGIAEAQRAPRSPQPAETGEERAERGPVITLKLSREKDSEPDVQKAILQVLSGSEKALALTEIAREIGTVHYAALIRPMRSLCAKGRVVKEENAYRLVV